MAFGKWYIPRAILLNRASRHKISRGKQWRSFRKDPELEFFSLIHSNFDNGEELDQSFIASLAGATSTFPCPGRTTVVMRYSTGIGITPVFPAFAPARLIPSCYERESSCMWKLCPAVVLWAGRDEFLSSTGIPWIEKIHRYVTAIVAE